MNFETKAAYNCGGESADHAVTIVGYDDDFAKENFKRKYANGKEMENSIPPENGAFIVKNSWGLADENDDGYFYLCATGERMWRSSNMISWSQIGTAFGAGQHPEYKGPNYFWAPSLNKIGDRYVMYFAVGKMGGTGDDFYIGVATSDTPGGPYAIYDNPATPEDERGVLFLSSTIGVAQSID